jgi:hypothetical protein
MPYANTLFSGLNDSNQHNGLPNPLDDLSSQICL